jgi:Glyoxalase/Bleomycin resistance protein/Dioxygenase superfamily
MFLSLDYLYVPAKDIEASVRYYTEQLGGELVWKIHAFETWVAGIRLSPTGPMVLLAEHLQGDTPILIYRVERLESTIAALRAQGWTAESGPFETRASSFSTPSLGARPRCRLQSPGKRPSLKRSRHIRTVLILQRSCRLIAQRLREPEARLRIILARRASSARTLRLRLMR